MLNEVPRHAQSSIMPWRGMGEWRYRSMHSSPRNPAHFTPGESPQYSSDRRLGGTQS